MAPAAGSLLCGAAILIPASQSLSSTAWIGLGCVVIGVAAMTVPARKVAIGASL